MRKNSSSSDSASRYDSSLPGATSMHVGMMCIAGLFFASQVVRLVYRTLTGTEDLGTVQFIALVIVMSLLALMSFFFAGYMGFCIRKAHRAAGEDASDLQAVADDSADPEDAGSDE